MSSKALQHSPAAALLRAAAAPLLMVLTLLTLSPAALAQDSDLEKRAKNSDNWAMTRLGEYYEAGSNGYTKDYAKAVEWFQKAADKGYATAQSWMGYMYQFGEGVTKDYAAALKWYKLAADQGDAFSMNKAGEFYYEGYGVATDYSQALQWFQKAADKGNITATNWMGYMYEFGKGVAKDWSQAKLWYQKSADKGNAYAMYRLAGLYYSGGSGVSQSYTDAMKWYKQAAEKGNADAMNEVGRMYENAQGVTQNYTEAAKWYRKSAEAGEAHAMTNLGRLYRYGNGMTQNYTEAISWFNKAIAKGNPNGMNEMGLLYENGLGVTKDFSEAVKYYQRGAEGGNRFSMYNLGKCYEYGFGVSKNPQLALQWYQKAIDAGHTSATVKQAADRMAALVKQNGGGNNPVPNPQPAVITGNSPTIDWLAATSSTGKEFTVKAGIKSDSQITSTSVTVNGQTFRGISAVGNDGYAMTLNQAVTLSEGQNIIKVSVTNAKGTTTMEKYVSYSPQQASVAANTVSTNVTDDYTRRIALVIGNSAYPDAALKNPVNDATDISSKLKSLGFAVTLVTNTSLRKMRDAIREFGQKVENYDVALFYYAGHAIQQEGVNYMIPVDAKLQVPEDTPYDCTALNYAQDMMDKCRMKILILDACRNDPFTRGWHRGTAARGLASIQQARGTVVAFATSPGSVAADGDGRNSPYTEALLQALDQPGLKIGDVFDYVYERVDQKTKGQQTPWVQKAASGIFYFNKNK